MSDRHSSGAPPGDEASIRRIPVSEADSGEIETLADGSISIPVFVEELVVEKKTVLKERVIISKQTVTDEERVTAELRQERVELQADDGVRYQDERGDGAKSLTSRRGGSETKPFVLTSEFWIALVAISALIATTAATAALGLWQGMVLLVVLVCAFMVSRGFAKAHTEAAERGRRRA